MQICLARLIRLLGHLAPKQLIPQPNPGGTTKCTIKAAAMGKRLRQGSLSHALIQQQERTCDFARHYNERYSRSDRYGLFRREQVLITISRINKTS